MRIPRLELIKRRNGGKNIKFDENLRKLNDENYGDFDKLKQIKFVKGIKFENFYKLLGFVMQKCFYYSAALFGFR